MKYEVICQGEIIETFSSEITAQIFAIKNGGHIRTNWSEREE